jgi:hypothetical protein
MHCSEVAVMDSREVKTFCDAPAQLVPTLVAHASVGLEKGKREDDALIGQLRVTAGPVAHALMKVPGQQPPQPALQPQSSKGRAP